MHFKFLSNNEDITKMDIFIDETIFTSTYISRLNSVLIFYLSCYYIIIDYIKINLQNFYNCIK